MKNCVRKLHQLPCWRPYVLPSTSLLLNKHYRYFSSLSPYEYRTSYEHFVPNEYNVINVGDNTPRLTEIESDLIVLPIYHDINDDTPQMVITNEPTKPNNNNTDEKSPESAPLNLSQLFDFETIRLNQKHGNILSKLLTESQILKNESKYKHIIARICGDELPYSFPKKILIVSLGKYNSNSNSNIKTGNNLIPNTLQQTRGLST
eukprot:256633_1